MPGSGPVSGRTASIYIENLAGASTSISPDIAATRFRLPRDTLDYNDPGAFGPQREVTVLDWEIALDGYVAVGASEIDEVIYDLHSAKQGTLMHFGPSGSTAGFVKYSGCAIVQDYVMDFGIEGAGRFSMTLQARSGSLTRGRW